MNNNEEQKDYTLDQIIEQSFDFSGYSDEARNQLISETSGMIMETALLRSIENAGEEMQEKFNNFIESNPEEDEMSEFISKNLPNFGEVVINEIKLFQEKGNE